ncbi:MAG: hypothetical protein AAGM04_04845 [Pseudomonadota bacterium]
MTLVTSLCTLSRRALLLAAIAFGASACVGSPITNVLQPDAPLPVSDPGVRNTGVTPSATAPTQSSAKQITKAERESIRQELTRAGVQNNAAKTKANSKSEAQYLKEVRALQNEANTSVAKRLREIEARKN